MKFLSFFPSLYAEVTVFIQVLCFQYFDCTSMIFPYDERVNFTPIMQKVKQKIKHY
jgi:hypothetical protein